MKVKHRLSWRFGTYTSSWEQGISVNWCCVKIGPCVDDLEAIDKLEVIGNLEFKIVFHEGAHFFSLHCLFKVENQMPDFNGKT